MKISVIGLGKLGATTLGVLASKGFDVLGVDINSETVQKISEGKSPIYEPGLQEILIEYSHRISASTDYSKVPETDMSIIIVPTPSDQDGNFSTEYVEETIKEIGKSISNKKEYHNVVVTSTVLPGSMEEVIKPLLENYSGKKVGKKLGLCYNPDFIAIGSIIQNLLHPDMILIGQSDEKAGDMLRSMHMKVVEETFVPIHQMNFYNAELAKISLNSFVTMKISFANTISELCEKMPKGNANHVLNCIGDDTRVGRKYLKPGLAYGGPCFPRDNRAFAYVSGKFNSQCILSKTTDMINEYQIDRITNIILDELQRKNVKSVSFLGLTYKPDSNLLEESASFYIMQKLNDLDVDVKVYDPSLKESFYDSLESCLMHSSVCFIATPWKEFRDISPGNLLVLMDDSPTVIDAWGIKEELKNVPFIRYLMVGVNNG